MLGFVFSLIYALSNGALMFLVKWVVHLIFPGSGHFNLVEQLQRAPAIIRPITKGLESWLSHMNGPTSRSEQILLISLLPAIALIRVISGYLNVYFANWAAVRAIADLRARLFDHIQNLPLSFFSTAKTGELVGRITSDTFAVHSIIANSMSSLIKDPFTILILLVVLISQPETRKLTVISLVVLPVCIVPMSIYARKVRKSAKAMQSHMAEINSVMHESFTGNRIVKAYNLENAMLEQFKEATRKYEAGLDCGAEANMAKMLAADASWEAANACVQTHGGFGFAEEYDIERKFRETRLYQVAPISTNLILSYLAEHVLGMPRSY